MPRMMFRSLWVALGAIIASGGLGTAQAATPSSAVHVLWQARCTPPGYILADSDHPGSMIGAAFHPRDPLLTTVGREGVLLRWDLTTRSLKERVALQLAEFDSFPSYAQGVAFTAQADRLVAASRDTAVVVFDTATGKEVGALNFPDVLPTGDVRVSTSADGKTLLASFPSRENNLATLVTVLGSPGDADPRQRLFIGPGRQRWSPTYAATLTPNGETALLTRTFRVPRAMRCEIVAFRSADTETEFRTEFGVGNIPLGACATPANREVVVTGPDGQLVLWDLATERSRALFEARVLRDIPPVISADGRTMAVFTASTLDTSYTTVSEYRVRVLEVATGGIRYDLMPRARVTSVALSPDGQRLAVGIVGRESGSYSALMWDLRPEALNWPWEKCQTPGDRLWSLLVQGSATQAWPALAELMARPAFAVELIRKQQPPRNPLPKPKPGEIARWIDALDAPLFADRQAAEQNLREQGRTVAPELREAFNNTRSAEVRERLAVLLERVKAPAAATRAEVRSVEILERIATPAARKLLEAYSNGPDHLALTHEARSARDRLPPLTP